MHKLGSRLLITGILVFVISGFEKILIFLSFQGSGLYSSIDSIALKNLTPSIIWNVPIATKNFGIIIIIIGIVLILFETKIIKDSIKLIKKGNEEYKQSSENNET